MSDNTTSTVRSLCPECNDNYVTTVRLKEGDVLVKCDCRTYYYYPLEDYLQIIEKKKNVLCTYSRLCQVHNEPYSAYCSRCSICETPCDKCMEEHIEKCYKNNMKKCKRYLQPFKGLPNTLLQIEEHLKYLSELKDKYKENEEIQNEYKKCVDRNSNVVKFVKILTENYHFDNKKMYRNMYKLTILNLYKPIDEKESTVLHYFKFFNFEQYTDFHSFKVEAFYPTKMILLKDGRIFYFSGTQKIYIFDISKLKLDLIITLQDIKSICQIENGNIIICTKKAFLIYSIGKDTYNCEHKIPIKENEEYRKMIHLENNIIAADNYGIRLWNMNKPYSDKPFKELNALHKE